MKPRASINRPYGSDDTAAGLEVLLGLRVGDEVEVPLPVTYFHVGEAVPLLGQGRMAFARKDTSWASRVISPVLVRKRGPCAPRKSPMSRSRNQLVLLVQDIPSQVNLNLA